MKRPRGITLVEVMVILVVLGMIACLLVPCFARVARQHRVEQCVSNLKTLHGAQKAFQDQQPSAPVARGRAFWKRLSQSKPPLVSPDTLLCPLAGPGAPADCQYWGPPGAVLGLADGEPLGCDQENNHSDVGSEGGNILLKSGSVITDNSLSEQSLWAGAVRLGKCVP